MKRFALLDCNNFFVSCERVFNPKLIGKPVVVLSSNDACIIARSNEAKALGIPMGAALFEYEKLLTKNNVKILSSNFALYADMSARVMKVLSDYSTDLEIYSIDEAFFFLPDFINTQIPLKCPSIKLSAGFELAFSSEQSQKVITSEESFSSVRPEPAEGFERNYRNSNNLNNPYDSFHQSYAQYIRQKIKQRTGISVSIGLGQTKTLAKIANKIAKKSAEGVFDITNHKQTDLILEKFQVKDIWGIGSRYHKKLYAKNILNAKDLKYCDDKWIQKNLTICGLKTVHELRGIPCLNLNEVNDPRKSLTVSRLFGRNIISIEELKEAVSSYIISAARKAREQNSIVSSISVFLIYTKYHDSERFCKSSSYNFSTATSYTPDLIRAASICVDKLFKSGSIYKKAGVILHDLYPSDFIQMNTYNLFPNFEKQSKIMQVIDNINYKSGKNLLSFASAGIDKSWKMKQLRRSQCFTTNWHELLTIKI